VPDSSCSRERSLPVGRVSVLSVGGSVARLRPSGLSTLLPVVICILCVAVGASGWTQVVADFFGRRDPTWIAEDFVAFYSAGRMLASGLGPDLLRVEVIGAVEQNVAGHPVGGSGILPYFHPPFVALAFTPLARLSLTRAYQVWTAINLVVLAANCWLLWLISDGIPKRWRVVVVVAYLTLAPVAYGLRLGQVSLILQAGLGAGYLWLVRGHDRLAGSAFAILLVKPEWLLLIAVFLAWKRRWSVLAVIVPASVVAIAVSVVAVGP
jgi:Glycosyltransferase family 87